MPCLSKKAVYSEMRTFSEEEIFGTNGLLCNLESSISISHENVTLARGTLLVVWRLLKTALDADFGNKHEKEFKVYQDAYCAITKVMPVIDVLLHYLERATYDHDEFSKDMEERFFNRKKTDVA